MWYREPPFTTVLLCCHACAVKPFKVMITRCHTRVLPVNENRPRMLGGSVCAWRQAWQKPTLDFTGGKIIHHFVTNLVSNSPAGDMPSAESRWITPELYFELCLFCRCAPSHSDQQEDFFCSRFSWLLLSGIAGNANSVCVSVCVCVCACERVCVLLSMYGAGSCSFICMQIMCCAAQLAHPLVCDWMWLALWCIWTGCCVGGWWGERSPYAKCQRRNHVMALVNQWPIDPVHRAKWNSWASWE